jgi:hypothetical protein
MKIDFGGTLRQIYVEFSPTDLSVNNQIDLVDTLMRHWFQTGLMFSDQRVERFVTDSYRSLKIGGIKFDE